ncbi:MAG: hypothetical protein EXQ70_01505 [Solirubrobacterales bacterium]|nr:hypothetical protein [Solirubrobacterales bacterium]
MSGKTYKKLKPGKHSFQLRASDDFGNVGRDSGEAQLEGDQGEEAQKAPQGPVVRRPHLSSEPPADAARFVCYNLRQ